MPGVPYRVDPLDPRAPPQADWDRMTEGEREQVITSLPSEIERAEPPEGDLHRITKTNALKALEEFYRRTGKRTYVSAELPIYYPGEPMFAPDLIAARDVEVCERNSWVVSREGKGIDFALEIRALGRARKDLEQNVERFARLRIPEYFVFDVGRGRLLGWQLAETGRYEAIIPQGGRWPSRVLELDLTLESGRLRFYAGSAPLLDARELITKLSSMVDEAVRRAEEEARRAEEEARRAEEEARRAIGLQRGYASSESIRTASSDATSARAPAARGARCKVGPRHRSGGTSTEMCIPDFIGPRTGRGPMKSSARTGLAEVRDFRD